MKSRTALLLASDNDLSALNLSRRPFKLLAVATILPYGKYSLLRLCREKLIKLADCRKASLIEARPSKKEKQGGLGSHNLCCSRSNQKIASLIRVVR